MAEEKPNCALCRHYFVTWDRDHPRGCRAFEVKSLEYPSVVVWRTSGRPCEAYEPKEPEGEAPREGIEA